MFCSMKCFVLVECFFRAECFVPLNAVKKVLSNEAFFYSGSGLAQLIFDARLRFTDKVIHSLEYKAHSFNITKSE